MTDMLHPRARSACGWTTFLRGGKVVRAEIQQAWHSYGCAGFFFEFRRISPSFSKACLPRPRSGPGPVGRGGWEGF